MRASTVSQHFPRIATVSQWRPLAFPLRRGETIRELHTRARRVLELIEGRCRELGVQRVLLVSHAATIIAMGRALLEMDGQETMDWETGSGIDIGTGTASLSVYTRQGGNPRWQWQQLRNGWTGHLPGGVEREWAFKYIPDNIEEPGMGLDWKDEEALEDEAEMLRLEAAGSALASALAFDADGEKDHTSKARF